VKTGALAHSLRQCPGFYTETHQMTVGWTSVQPCRVLFAPLPPVGHVGYLVHPLFDCTPQPYVVLVNARNAVLDPYALEHSSAFLKWHTSTDHELRYLFQHRCRCNLSSLGTASNRSTLPTVGLTVSLVATGKLVLPHADVAATAPHRGTEDSHTKSTHRYFDRRFGNEVLENSSSHGARRLNRSHDVSCSMTCHTAHFWRYAAIIIIPLTPFIHFASGSAVRSSSIISSFSPPPTILCPHNTVDPSLNIRTLGADCVRTIGGSCSLVLTHSAPPAVRFVGRPGKRFAEIF
jgi:hypothetical protein